MMHSSLTHTIVVTAHLSTLQHTPTTTSTTLLLPIEEHHPYSYRFACMQCISPTLTQHTTSYFHFILGKNSLREQQHPVYVCMHDSNRACTPASSVHSTQTALPEPDQATYNKYCATRLYQHKNKLFQHIGLWSSTTLAKAPTPSLPSPSTQPSPRTLIVVLRRQSWPGLAWRCL